MQQVIYFAILLFFINPASASETCVSGKPTEGNLVSQLQLAKKTNPITQKIYSLYNLDTSKTEAQTCNGNCSAKSTAPISPITVNQAPTAPQLIFKPECLSISNQTKTNTPEVSCPDGNKIKSRGICITESFLKYQNSVISNFYSCISKENFIVPSPEALYTMYSLESGFKPQYSYRGGVGLGQLTKPFVDDIHQQHRGMKFLKKISNSSSPECEVAKAIAQKDINIKPNISNSCSFISVGDGLERNILYSFIGFANSWERDIEPKLRQYIKRYPQDSNLAEIKNLALLNAYGSGGRAAARAAITRLSHLKPDDFIKALKGPLKTRNGQSLTVYTTRLERKKRDLAKRMPEPLKSHFVNTGAKACIQAY